MSVNVSVHVCEAYMCVFTVVCDVCVCVCGSHTHFGHVTFVLVSSMQPPDVWVNGNVAFRPKNVPHPTIGHRDHRA